MKPVTKNTVMYGLLAITLLLTYWSSQNEIVDVDTVNLVEKKQARQSRRDLNITTTSASPDLRKWRLSHAKADQASVDLFSSNQWVDKQAELKLSALQKAQKPLAPNPPFSYIGKMDQSSEDAVHEKSLLILMMNSQLLTVSVGQVINMDWRIDREDDKAIYLSYLPLNEQKVLLKIPPQIAAADEESPMPREPD
jgi:hypothetical protein